MRGEGVASVRRRHNGSTVPLGDAHLGDRVHLTTLLREGRTEFGDVHDVVFCPGRELRTSLLSLSGHWRLVHVEHVQSHLDHAEGEPKNVRKLQKYLFSLDDQYNKQKYVSQTS
jgi:hypothetical protein